MPLETIVALLPSVQGGGIALVVLLIVYQMIYHGVRITVEPLKPPKRRKHKRDEMPPS